MHHFFCPMKIFLFRWSQTDLVWISLDQHRRRTSSPRLSAAPRQSQKIPMMGESVGGTERGQNLGKQALETDRKEIRQTDTERSAAADQRQLSAGDCFNGNSTKRTQQVPLCFSGQLILREPSEERFQRGLNKSAYFFFWANYHDKKKKRRRRGGGGVGQNESIQEHRWRYITKKDEKVVAKWSSLDVAVKKKK